VLALLLGFLFGFIGSIPVAGPISLLVVAYGLRGRYRDAIFLAAGGALAESGYAALSFWGMSALLARYPAILPWSRAAGAVVLLGLGSVFVSGGGMKESTQEPDSKRRSFLTGFGLTALNPTLIVTWTAATTTLYGTGLLSPSRGAAAPFSIGAFVGIVAWFSVLVALIERYRDKFRPSLLGRMIQVIGLLLIGLGLFFAWLFVRSRLG
jgi:threonine/homoserine/homoserine lactone efflux protein